MLPDTSDSGFMGANIFWRKKAFFVADVHLEDLASLLGPPIQTKRLSDLLKVCARDKIDIETSNYVQGV